MDKGRDTAPVAMVAFEGSPIRYSGKALDKMKKLRGRNFGEPPFMWVVRNAERLELVHVGKEYKTIVH